MLMLEIIKDLISLIGWPFFTVLLGFVILIVELFVFGVLMLFTVLRIRKEMINMNRKMDRLVQLSEKKPETETGKEPQKESQKEPRKEPEIEQGKQPEAEYEKEHEKKKYRYKWK
jgi:hypothetical protein